ncbi:MAG: RNA polymerase factor sigma-54 [Oscillospiraceae bacterium]
MELNLSLKQAQILSPQMMQSMEILQMGSQELLEYLETTVQENPVLELDPASPPQDEFPLLRHKLDWLESTDVQNSFYHRQDSDDDPLEQYGGVDDGAESLYSYVHAQLPQLDLPPEELCAAEFLVESLGENGWLDEELSALAASFGCTELCMAHALTAVQSLEPAGVAARNLSECLRLQLLRQDGEQTLALEIVDHYLEALAKSRYGLIAKELQATPDAVRDACALIKTLNPRPSTGFAAREPLTYITPDVFVIPIDDHFELLTNDYFSPTLRMSAYYQSLAKDTEDTAVRDYLSEKMRQAKWVIRSIEQRRSTLLGCAQCILERQEAFFRKGAGHLLPMSLADIAGKLEVHESTVSRAMRDKYLQCSMGVYPLSYFFSRSLGAPDTAGEEGGASPDAAKALLRRLIAAEDPRKPLSDQKLCTLMAAESCLLSRRTVAKYRDELNIPSTTGRKQYE